MTVFLTGASGNLGRAVVGSLRNCDELRTLRRRPAPEDPNAIIGDLQNRAKLRCWLAGVDVLVHLAAVSNEAPFVEQIVPANIVGAYNIFQAAHEAGVRRIVFASSCHTVPFRHAEAVIDVDDPYRPETTYGVSKAFGEVLGRYYHEWFGVEFVAIRIGWLLPNDDPELHTSALKRGIWLSPRDAIALLRLAIEKPGVGYAVVFGTSLTSPEVVSLRAARERLGYEPQDSVAARYDSGD
jgi:uronate dehydrogenase